jgi:hypothetical protein
MRWRSATVKAQIKVWRNGISFGLNDLDALFTGARGQGVDGHSRLKALRFVNGKPPAFGGFLHHAIGVSVEIMRNKKESI